VSSRRGSESSAADGDLFAPPFVARQGQEDPGASAESAVAISTLSSLVKDVVEGAVPPLWVRGEVTGFKPHRNGHWYFTLRDAEAQMKCVIWARDARRLPAPPDEGMQVAAFGRLSVFAARTEVQLSISRLEAEGDGLWRKAFDEARARLEADGLLAPERRRPLPTDPRVLAVITSPDGAALHDIIAVARQRDPGVDIVVVPSAVQGEGAPDELVRALDRVARWGGADLVIVGRGGGSREDLWCFNDERVARAVAACPVPTISAVGHEVDISLTDLVADVRAATPSNAAEIAVPVRADRVAALGRLRPRLASALAQRARRARADLTRAGRDLAVGARRVVEIRRAVVERHAASIDALSPLRTLARGYAVAQSADGRPRTALADFAPGDEFSLRVRDGIVHAQTLDVRPLAP
jgi:exodeoxyribonuclease VII large subunit